MLDLFWTVLVIVLLLVGGVVGYCTGYGARMRHERLAGMPPVEVDRISDVRQRAR